MESVKNVQLSSITKLNEQGKLVLGIDPGEKKSGFALLEVLVPARQVDVHRMWLVKPEQFSEELAMLPLLDMIACEDFTLRPGKQTEFLNKGYTKLTTAKFVGRVEQYALERNIPLRCPQPAEKPFGYKLIGKEYVKGKPNMDIYDAAAHARTAIRKMWSV